MDIDTKSIVARVKRAVEAAVDDEEADDALDIAQDVIDDVVSEYRRKGVHFRAEARSSSREELQLQITHNGKKTVVAVPL